MKTIVYKAPEKPLQHKFEDAGVTMWQCGCGSSRFHLRSDKKAECCGCGKFPPYRVKHKP